LEGMSKKEQKKLKKEEHKRKVEERKQEAGTVRKIVLAVVVIIILVIAAAGFGAYRYIAGALEPMDEESDETVEVEIPIGSSTGGIADRLEENNLISNAAIFRYYVRLQGESDFQAGNYELSPSMSADEIIMELQEGTLYEDYAASFVVPEGFWAEQIYNRIAEETDIAEEEIQETARDEEFLESLIEEYSIVTEEILTDEIREPLEGYLFPARYDLTEEEMSAEEVLKKMVTRMERELENAAEASSVDSFHEFLTKASIIEGEARNDDERPAIAGVIENRLRVPMRLQMDPTVQYAHGEQFSRTLITHTEIESPYNTYYVEGLPAGPINNPGYASLEAASDPDGHNYLYFFHSPDGEVYFNETLDEHNAVVGEYRE
jgi:UPF0755 protein